MKQIIPFLFLSLLGCASVQESEVPIDQPELIRMAPFPVAGTAFAAGQLKLNVLLHVAGDGTVSDVRLLAGTGIAQWDTLAIQSIKQWVFRPARRDGLPVDAWIRQVVVVRVQEPLKIKLSQLVFTTRQEADSQYQRLEHGADFDTLVQESGGTPGAERSGFLGEVDVAVYPPVVREALRRLREGEFTHPLRVGDRYIIYKRLKS
jgi:TonB family protein